MINTTYLERLEIVKNRASYLLANLRRGAQTKPQQDAVKALEIKFLRLRDSVHGVECLIRECHNVAFVHGIKIN